MNNLRQTFNSTLQIGSILEVSSTSKDDHFYTVKASNGIAINAICFDPNVQKGSRVILVREIEQARWEVDHYLDDEEEIRDRENFESKWEII